MLSLKKFGSGKLRRVEKVWAQDIFIDCIGPFYENKFPFWKLLVIDFGKYMASRGPLTFCDSLTDWRTTDWPTPGYLLQMLMHLKMTGGTLRQKFNLFDIWHLTFAHLNIWKFATSTTFWILLRYICSLQHNQKYCEKIAEARKLNKRGTIWEVFIVRVKGVLSESSSKLFCWSKLSWSLINHHRLWSH